MSLKPHDLRPTPGSTHRRKRVGRGDGSGRGTYSGRGMKGQNSRSGGGVRRTFEGGQMPLVRRLQALRGFNNKWKVYYQPVNVGVLEQFPAGTDVTPDLLKETGVLRHLRQPVKILGDGELSTKLNVTAHRVSSSARAKIEGAGGSVTELSPRKSKMGTPASP
ncbi:MAG: 50S ribosomal protein L15 [Dehalococcoidia bacterium]|nr:50S ribosomal protein L15 [Dehalococcoidia bacterium]